MGEMESNSMVEGAVASPVSEGEPKARAKRRRFEKRGLPGSSQHIQATLCHLPRLLVLLSVSGTSVLPMLLAVLRLRHGRRDRSAQVRHQSALHRSDKLTVMKKSECGHETRTPI